jgi:hypothetical protein
MSVGIAKICKGKSSLSCYMDKKFLDILQTNRIVFSFEDELSIKRSGEGDEKTYKISNGGAFCFGAKKIEDSLIGAYDIYDMGNDIFSLIKQQ